MKTLSEFDVFYDQEIKSLVIALEKKRVQLIDRFSFRKYRRNLKILLVICIVNGIVMSTVPAAPKPLVGIFFVSCVYAIFAPLVIFIKRNLNFDPINKEYKETVIPRILKFLGTNLNYSATSGISQDEFTLGRMFESRIVAYKSEDMVEGTIDGIRFRLSDVRADGKNERSRQSKGVHNTTYSLLHGLYAVTTLPAPITSRILIKGQHKFVDALAGFARNILGDSLTDTLIDGVQAQTSKTGNALFDKTFTVYTQDEALMTSLLNPNMQQLILALRDEIDLKIIISIFDDQAHIAFDGMDLFKANASDSLIENNISRRYFQCINHTIGLAGAIRKTV